MAHARIQSVSGLAHSTILLTAGLAIAAAAFFILLIPGARTRLWESANTRVSIAQPSYRAASVSAAPLFQKSGNANQSLVARVLSGINGESQTSADVVFDTREPDARATPFALSASPAEINGTSSAGKPARTVLISEIMLADADSAQHEFVELYNPNNGAVDLAGWEMRKKTQSGTDSVLLSSKKFSGVIPAHGYFLIAHPDYVRAIHADASWSGTGYSVSQDNTVYLEDDQERIIDSVGMGEAGAYEGAAASNPGIGLSIARASAVDTDNNRNDFIMSDPSPQNASYAGGFIAPIAFVPAPSPTQTPVQPTPSFAPAPTISFSPQPTPTSDPTPTPTASPLPTPTPSPSPSPEPTLRVHPIIVHVQFGIEGSANADFIQMQNMSSVALDLTDYKLIKKTASSGAEYTIKSWRNDQQSAPASSYFYWVNAGYADEIADLQSQGALFFTTSATVSETNGVALTYQDAVVSSVQW